MSTQNVNNQQPGYQVVIKFVLTIFQEPGVRGKVQYFVPNSEHKKDGMISVQMKYTCEHGDCNTS